MTDRIHDLANSGRGFDQGCRLLAMGCELAQGYVIARPMPAAAFLDWLAHWKPCAAWTTVERPAAH